MGHVIGEPEAGGKPEADQNPEHPQEASSPDRTAARPRKDRGADAPLRPNYNGYRSEIDKVTQDVGYHPDFILASSWSGPPAGHAASRGGMSSETRTRRLESRRCRPEACSTHPNQLACAVRRKNEQLPTLSDAPQRLRRPQEQLAVRNRDGAQTIVVHIVLSQHLEFGTLLDHRRDPVFIGVEDVA